MLAGIKPAQCVDAKEGRKKQRRKAAAQGRLAVMQQGKVVARMRVLVGLNHLYELGHNRDKGLVLVEPMGKQMHAHKRQTGRDSDDLCARGTRPMAWHLTRASLATIELPLSPPAVDMADAHRHWSLSFGDLVEEHPTRALRVLLEHGPPQGLLHVAALSSSTQGWTCTFIEVRLTQGAVHDFILLHIQFRMKSAP